MRNAIALILAVLLALGAGYWLRGSQPPPPDPAAGNAVASLPAPEPIQVKSRLVQADLVSVGNLTPDPDREARIGSPMAGRVAALYVKVGDRVSQGTPLMLITSPEITRLAADHHHAELRLAQALAIRDQTAQAILLGDETRRPLEESRTEYVTESTERQVRRSNLRLAEQNLKRVEGLFQLGVVPARDLEVARAERYQAQVRVGQSQELVKLAASHREREQLISQRQAVTGPKLKQLELDIELAREEVRHLRVILDNLGLDPAAGGKGLVVRAPRRGTVVERLLSLGQAVDAQQEAFRIVDSGQLWLWLYLPERDTSVVKRGSLARLRLPGEEKATFQGRVDYLSPVVDPDTRTIKARVVVNNGGSRLRAGTFIQASFGQKKRSILTVPPSAVAVEGTTSVVFRSQGGTFERVTVEVGERQDDWVEIRQGLQRGDRVASSAQAVLQREGL